MTIQLAHAIFMTSLRRYAPPPSKREALYAPLLEGDVGVADRGEENLSLSIPYEQVG